MNVIEQKLVVKDWPLKQPGDEMFFGYVLAVGVFPFDWNEKGMFLYADFAYGDGYSRYRLPADCKLIDQLMLHLCANLQTAKELNNIFGKVWIELTKEGYKVSLP